MNTTIAALLESGQQQIESDTPQLDAQILLAHVLEKDRSYFYAHPDQVLDQEQADQFYSLIQNRASGHPIAHLIGEREFWSLHFLVSPETLIPRPETEHLVEFALELIKMNSYRSILDLGTGTGAIAISIAHSLAEEQSQQNQTDYQITAADISEDALKIAEQNRQRLAPNIQLIQSRWFNSLSDQRFDLIVSNPPYVAESHPLLNEGDVRFEPKLALTSGEDGLDDIRQIIQQAPEHLNSKGCLLLEHGYDQAKAIHDLLSDHGFIDILTLQDFAGQDRLTLGRRS